MAMMFTSFFSWDMGEFDEYNHWGICILSI